MYPEIERKLKETLNEQEMKSFVTHFLRLQLLIDHRVKDKRLRKHMSDEAELFRQGLEDHIRSMQVTVEKMQGILDQQWDRSHGYMRTTSTPSS